MKCPFCRRPAEAEFVDNGVGEERCSPWRCDSCHAYQCSSFDEYDNAIQHGAIPEPITEADYETQRIVFTRWVRYAAA